MGIFFPSENPQTQIGHDLLRRVLLLNLERRKKPRLVLLILFCARRHRTIQWYRSIYQAFFTLNCADKRLQASLHLYTYTCNLRI